MWQALFPNRNRRRRKSGIDGESDDDNDNDSSLIDSTVDKDAEKEDNKKKKDGFVIVDGVLKSKSDLTCEESYFLDMETAYTNLKKKKSRRDKKEALRSIAMLAWVGCDRAQMYASKSGLLQYLSVLLKESVKVGEEAYLADQMMEVKEMKEFTTCILRALSVITRMNKKNQEILRNNDVIELLVDLLNDDSEQLRKWACHCLYIVLLNNAENQTMIITMSSLVTKLNELRREQWHPLYWEGNQALLIMKILGWHDVSKDEVADLLHPGL